MSDAAVQKFLETMQSRPTAADDELSQMLQDAGFTAAIAERTLAFVPMACARVVLRGAKFPDVYLIPDPATGVRERHRFADDAVFVAAQAAVARLGSASPMVIRAAARSAELGVAQRLMGPGGSPSDLVFTEPVLMRIPPTGARPAKPWWRFW